ncbi:MAG: hypothetical protein R2873_14715 [Caldilineaceae bacterium]|nr:hypothetical protein [Caldilineaceae bacterium]
MPNVTRTLLDGIILSAISTIYLLGIMLINPRIMLGDYPKAIQERVPAKTEREGRLSLLIGVPFLALLLVAPLLSTWLLEQRSGDAVSFVQLFFNAAGVVFVFNLFDLLILDWLIFCLITPKFIMIPGSEGMAAYKDFGFHFRGFLVGTTLSIVVGLVVAGIVWLL